MIEEKNKKNNIFSFQKDKPFWLLFILGFLIYLPTIFFGFTYLDDNTLILDNQYFLSNIFNFFNTFTTDVFHLFNHSAFYYRPILTISFIFDCQLGGVHPFIYHLTNISLHIVSAYLVFLSLIKLNYKRTLSFLFSILFLVHPVLTQAVSWIPGRNDSLLMVFVLLTFVFFINYLNDNKKKDLFLSLLFFFFSIFTKESGVLIIPLLIIFSLFIYKKENKKISNIYYFLTGSFIIFLLWFFLRRIALYGSTGLTFIEMLKSVFFNFPAVIQFIGKIFLPFNLSVLPIIGDTTFIYGIISVILLFFAIFFTKNKRWNYILFGGLWFLAFLLPSFIRPNSKLVADFIEHRVYVPIIGIFIILLETDLFKKINLENKKTKIIILFVIFLFSIINIIHSFAFANKTNFWENAVKNSPNYPLAHRNLGAMKFLDGDYDAAEIEFKKALILNKNEEMAHNNLGLIYARRGEYEKSEIEYKKELEINPNYDNSYYNLGLLYWTLGREDDAVLTWKKTVEVNPNYVDAYKRLLFYYYEKKDYENASIYAKPLINLQIILPSDLLNFIELTK